MDPRKIQFKESAPRPIIEDDDARGLNCSGCCFERQRAAVCCLAAEEAVRRKMRDCDSVDQFGEQIVYLRTDVDPRQTDIFGDSPT